MMDSEKLLRWIARSKFYGCYEKDKPRSIEYARSWINEECINNGWSREAVLKASKHTGCTNITEFKKLCNYFQESLEKGSKV